MDCCSVIRLNRFQVQQHCLREPLIYSAIHADGIFLRPATSQKPRNSAAIPSVSFLAGRKNLLVIAKISFNQWFPKFTQANWRSAVYKKTHKIMSKAENMVF